LSKPRLDEKENVTMSGFIGQILGNMMGGQQAGQPAAIAGILQQLLAANGGGVASVVSRFEAAGLGSNAQSWVSTGENQPVSRQGRRRKRCVQSWLRRFRTQWTM
jgi:uncharacterized protein YidB (DUF937 family)